MLVCTAYASEGYAPFLMNWLESLEALGLDEFVVLALDQATVKHLATLGLQHHTVDFSAEGPTTQQLTARQAVSWYDQAYRQLMGSQPARVLRVLEAGAFDLLVSDADILWRVSPWSVLYAPSRRHCQIQAIRAVAPTWMKNATLSADTAVVIQEPHPQVKPYPHMQCALPHAGSIVTHRSPLFLCQANCPNCINAGFMFLRRGNTVHELMLRWAKHPPRRSVTS